MKNKHEKKEKNEPLAVSSFFRLRTYVWMDGYVRARMYTRVIEVEYFRSLVDVEYRMVAVVATTTTTNRD
jgi:hypothetical protein